jgi:hypothetical protein
MKRHILFALFTIFFSNCSLATLILTFDDTVPGFVADGYGGLNWDNFRLYPLNTAINYSFVLNFVPFTR